MRCHEFDSQIDEMLAGVLRAEASEHLQECERCNSHFRGRTAVQNQLRQLSAVVDGPSRKCDRAVMEAYRQLQQRRTSGLAAPSIRVLSFPKRSRVPLWGGRVWWRGAAAAAVLLAVFGSTIHLMNVPSVNAPVAKAPAVETKGGAVALTASAPAAHNAKPMRVNAARAEAAAPVEQAAAVNTPVAMEAQPVMTAGARAEQPSMVYAGGQSYESAPVTELSNRAQKVLHLANAGVAQTASSTWPGYSNLMYCDPVVCAGPMQVMHIKVPVGQVKPNLGQTMGNAFVNADVVVGPDGVARAIRVAH